ncbi:unnamed protein product [Heterobilharzia americana]|nr:unnamed protein product [Heterobilharzia americana]
MAVTRVAIILGEVLEEKQKSSLLKEVIQGLASCPPDLLTKFQSHLDGLGNNQQCSLECIFCHQSEDFEFLVLCRPSTSTITSLLTSFLLPPKKSDVSLSVILIYAGLLSDGSAHWLLPNFVITPTFLADFIHHLSTLYPKSDDAENQPPPKPIRLHIGIGGVASGGDWRQLVSSPPQSIGGHAFQVSVNRCRTITKPKGREPTDTASPPTNPFDFESFLCSVMTKLPDPYCLPLSQALALRSPADPTLKVSKPCIYLFPEGSGQASILVLPGYNMLINAGCSYRPCFWHVANYVDRLDSVLVTHWGIDNILGLSAILPAVFTPNTKQSPLCLLTPPPNVNHTKVNNTVQDQPQFPVNIPIHISELVGQLKSSGTNLVVYPLTRGGKQSVVPKPVQLFQKVGQGCLELFPLTPGDEDSAELRKLSDDWSKASTTLTTTAVPLNRTLGSKTTVSLLSYTSVSALVIWRPAKDNEPILRFLFVSPNAHQTRILSSLDALITGFIYLRHTKAVPAEYERKRPVQPLSAVSRRPTAAAHTTATSNESSLSSVGQNHHNATRLSYVPKKTLQDGVSHRPPSSSKGIAANKTSSLAKNSVKVNQVTESADAVEANSEELSSKQSETCDNESVVTNHNIVDGEADNMNGDVHKPNGYVHDMSDREPSLYSEQANDDFMVRDVTTIEVEDHSPRDVDVHPNLSPKGDSQLTTADDPIASWGTPQNLPLPTGSEALKKPAAVANGEKKTAPHMPIRRNTSVSATSVNVTKTSRLSLAPRAGTHLTGSSLSFSYAPGYTIASGHATGPKVAPYDKVKPMYVDVAFLPGGGNPNYVDAEWFKRVRARYYVATDVRPTCSLLESLVVGKESWSGEDAQLEVSLILAYDTEEILIWLGVNAGRLNNCHVNVAAVISRSSIQIMNEETTGDASLNYPGYRLDVI